MNVTITDEFRAVRALVQDGVSPLAVLGRAGVGKSTLLQLLRKEWSLDKRMIVAAPTGVAALNCGGVTVHSAFQLPPRFLDPTRPHEVKVDRPGIQALSTADIIVFDEMSMLRCDMVDAIDYVLRQATETDEPFGGKQVLMFGDLAQLPPVVTGRRDNSEYLSGEELLASCGYPSPHFFSARVFREQAIYGVHLTQVFRQTDPEFVTMLNHIRDGTNLEAVCDQFNHRCYNRVPALDNEVILTATNAVADQENLRQLRLLPGPSHTYKSRAQGAYADNKDERLPVPAQLTLCPGARVMFRMNDTEQRWVNGTLGTVVEVGEGGPVVRPDGTNAKYQVLPETWSRTRYVASPKGPQPKQAGRYTQTPLSLAWAVSIHKSQGLTLDKVCIDVGSGAFASGQVYVALSRCRTLAGLRLHSGLVAGDIYVDAVAQSWSNSVADNQDGVVAWALSKNGTEFACTTLAD